MLLRALDGYRGAPETRAALRLAPLLFVRPGELRAARWSEFDLDAKEWRIPAERMKLRIDHLVPLSDQALEILRDLHLLTGHRSEFLFPSVRTRGRPMSENTINAALRRLGCTSGQMTGHGFRSIATTLLNEQGWSRDAIERQMAHAPRDTVRAAYNRAEHLDERRRMMQAWSDHLDGLKAGGNVVALRAGGVSSEKSNSDFSGMRELVRAAFERSNLTQEERELWDLLGDDGWRAYKVERARERAQLDAKKEYLSAQ